MRRKLTWTLAVLGLVFTGAWMACTAKYSAQYNGLVVVPSRDDQVLQSFSLNLSNGEAVQINNPSFPLINGVLASIILNPAGDYAFTIITSNPSLAGSSTGIGSSQIVSDGKLTGPTLKPLNNAKVTVPNNPTPESVPVNPVALAIDSAGKYLFVADSATMDSAGNQVPGAVSVFSIGGNGNLTEVGGSPFVLPVNGIAASPPNPCTATFKCSSASALAVTPTIYPTQYAVCQLQSAPSTENLYVTDSVNYVVLNYSVNLSTGALSLVPIAGTVGVPTGTAPSGVAVDPCNRFVYVSNSVSNDVSAYTICNTVSMPNCPLADFRLLPVTGSPYSTGDAPGPLSVDAYGNFLYVVATGSSYINAFRIGSANGSLVALSPATYATSTALGQDSGSNSIAIRSDDSFLFVANDNTQTLSEFGLAPATGTLSPESPVSTFNYPSGVAVK